MGGSEACGGPATASPVPGSPSKGTGPRSLSRGPGAFFGSPGLRNPPPAGPGQEPRTRCIASFSACVTHRRYAALTEICRAHSGSGSSCWAAARWRHPRRPCPGWPGRRPRSGSADRWRGARVAPPSAAGRPFARHHPAPRRGRSGRPCCSPAPRRKVTSGRCRVPGTFRRPPAAGPAVNSAPARSRRRMSLRVSQPLRSTSSQRLAECAAVVVVQARPALDRERVQQRRGGAPGNGPHGRDRFHPAGCQHRSLAGSVGGRLDGGKLPGGEEPAEAGDDGECRGGQQCPRLAGPPSFPPEFRPRERHAGPGGRGPAGWILSTPEA